ncbi:hypothetical protein AB833_10455 [Chromatiales bacterium (ex Bugula neritina AB1)]|nr:hypothetical protein AB833_10455 [Chromatiales bacterium (ex Bugula neritina AB1)]
MKIYLGLGSNLGDRKENLRRAIAELQNRGVTLLRASPVIETPALLPDDAPWEWNQPFFNMAIHCETDHTPEQLRNHIAEIQNLLGRDNKSRWSPRPMDIDILLWGDEVIQTKTLTIPHRDLHKRHFVLTPMIALAPTLKIPGNGDKTLLQWSLTLPHHIPQWMGILNITPDSFSDGGRNHKLQNSISSIETMVNHGANILDIGGESTRPGADTIDTDTEWARIGPVLTAINDKWQSDVLRPQVSVDTRNPAIARRAIDSNVHFINDVTGLTSPGMLELAASSDCEWIAMHSLSVPADSNVTFGPDVDPVAEVGRWIETSIERWDKAGIGLHKIIVDPGIGFGKNPLQSLKILQNAGSLRQYGLRLLMGHSRKSFMKSFAGPGTHERDMTTIGSAMQLCQQGVDILRVHNIPDHLAAYRGWSHLAE